MISINPKKKIKIKGEIISAIRDIMWEETLDPSLRPQLPGHLEPMEPLENGYFSKAWPKGDRGEIEREYYGERELKLAEAIKILVDYL